MPKDGVDVIKVTKHAIKRYRERLFNYSSSNEEIIHTLARIAKLGKIVCFKPNDLENCIEIKYNGISVVAVKQEQDLIIITCLGEDKYRKWIKSKGTCSFVSQSLLYGN